MRLPALTELTTEGAHLLRAHDVAEYHCQDPSSFYSHMHCNRIGAVIHVVRDTLSTGRILDLGCAQGNTGLLLAEAGFQVWAVDLRSEFLEYARRKYERGGFWCVAANATTLPFQKGFFDLVVWGEMIEHVAYPEQILAEIMRVLRWKGYLLITTPNGKRFRTGLPTFSQVADREKLVEVQFKPDSDGHLFLFTADELTQLLRSHGLEVLHHQFYATPWICGRLGLRHLIGWMPERRRQICDRWTLRWGRLAERVAEGQILLAQRQ